MEQLEVLTSQDQNGSESTRTGIQNSTGSRIRLVERRISKFEMQLQKMISLNGIWMILLACAGLSIAFTTLSVWQTLPNEKKEFSTDKIFGQDIQKIHLHFLLTNFSLIFFAATFWLVYLLNPLRWIRTKILASVLVTCCTAANIIFGFIILLNFKQSPQEDELTELNNDTIKLFVITILIFSSSCFFTRMAFMIEKKRREGRFEVENENEDISVLSSRTIYGVPSNLNIPGVADKPPKYDELQILDQKYDENNTLPNYGDLFQV